MPRGGPRPNSGGARPGAGRKPKPAAPAPESDPATFLLAVMRGEVAPSSQQMDAAKALLRGAATGVKEQRQKDAEAVVDRFKPRPAPLKLVAGG